MTYLHISMNMNATGFKQALGGKTQNVKPLHSYSYCLVIDLSPGKEGCHLMTSRGA